MKCFTVSLYVSLQIPTEAAPWLLDQCLPGLSHEKTVDPRNFPIRFQETTEEAMPWYVKSKELSSKLILVFM